MTRDSQLTEAELADLKARWQDGREPAFGDTYYSGHYIGGYRIKRKPTMDAQARRMR